MVKPAIPTRGWYRVTIPNVMCCAVAVNNDRIIVKTAPILRKFRGQLMMNLVAWITRLSGDVDRLETPFEEEL